MAVPWLRLLDGVLGARDVVRAVRQRTVAVGDGGGVGAMEAPLAGVVVGALREAFSRDSERLELERQRLDDERARAEAALRLELLRQTGERELGRLRLLSMVALAGLLGSFLLASGLMAAGDGPRVALGVGWCCLLGALAASFIAQAEVGRVMATAHARTPASDLTDTRTGIAAPWCVVAGLAMLALAVLL